MPRVLITTEALWRAAGPHLDMLHAAGCEVCYADKSALSTEEETLANAQGCVAVLAGSEPYTDRVLAGLPELRVISRNGVGYDRIDVPAATRRGVAVTITPDANHQAVAEHTLALMLAVSRSIVLNARETYKGVWKRQKAFIPLRGSTLGIIGLGRIGRSVALRAKAFGMTVIACEQCPHEEFVKQHDIRLVDLNTLLAESDFVSLHAPATNETRHLINRGTLARMRPGSVLINAARGGLVNEEDLLAALQSGHLRGAGLDVLNQEPPRPDHPLLTLDNVVISPHVASFDTRALLDMSMSAAQNIIEILSGRWPLASMVNPEVASPEAGN